MSKITIDYSNHEVQDKVKLHHGDMVLIHDIENWYETALCLFRYNIHQEMHEFIILESSLNLSSILEDGERMFFVGDIIGGKHEIAGICDISIKIDNIRYR